TGAVDDDGRVGVGAARREVVLRAAQVAGAFFAGGAHELYRALGVKRRSLEGFDDRQHRGDAAGVVGDARPEVAGAGLAHRVLRAAREHRVQMRADGDRWPVRAAGASADDVSGAVDLDALEAERLEPRGEPVRAIGL